MNSVDKNFAVSSLCFLGYLWDCYSISRKIVRDLFYKLDCSLYRDFMWNFLLLSPVVMHSATSLRTIIIQFFNLHQLRSAYYSSNCLPIIYYYDCFSIQPFFPTDRYIYEIM